MKPLFVLLAIAVTATAALGQATVGRIAYGNQSGSEKFPVYVHVLDGNSVTSFLVPKGTATTYTVELWRGYSPTDYSAFFPVAGTQVRDWVAPGIFKGNANLDIPGTEGGDMFYFQLRGWDNQNGTIKSWAEVFHHPPVTAGLSNIMPLRLGGVDSTGMLYTPGSVVTGLQQFALIRTPEPSFLALGTLSLVALALRRRN